jgi:hypothetical protein
MSKIVIVILIYDRHKPIDPKITGNPSLLPYVNLCPITNEIHLPSIYTPNKQFTTFHKEKVLIYHG